MSDYRSASLVLQMYYNPIYSDTTVIQNQDSPTCNVETKELLDYRGVGLWWCQAIAAGVGLASSGVSSGRQGVRLPLQAS